MNERVPIIVFGFDYNKNRDRAGNGTRLRCLEGVDVYHKLQQQRDSPFFIVSPSRAPGVDRHTQPKTMAEMMKSVLRALNIPEEDICIGEETWDTRGELLSATRLIVRLKRESNNIHKAYLISNKSHLRRIRVLAFWLKRNLKLDWQWKSSAAHFETVPWTWRHEQEENFKCLRELVAAREWKPALD